MANKNLSNAKNAKNDEFYTQLNDIQAEVNAYIDYDPDVFVAKRFFSLATIQSGATSRASSHRTSRGSD